MCYILQTQEIHAQLWAVAKGKSVIKIINLKLETESNRILTTVENYTSNKLN